MKKILYTSIQLPWPQDNGQKVVSFNDLKSLADNFEVDVICNIDPLYILKKDEYLDELKKHLPTVHFFDPIDHQILRGNLLKDKIIPFISSFFRGIPYVISRYRNHSYISLTNRVLTDKKYDVLYIDGLQPSHLLYEIADEQQAGLTIVYRMMDAFYETLAGYSKGLGTSLTSFATKFDYSKSVSYEKQLWKRVDFILPVTKHLGKMVIEELPDLKSKVIYLPVTVELVKQQRQDFESIQRVLYIGTIHYPPNQLGLEWFLNECWPLVLEKKPKATLEIVGRGGKMLLPVHPSVQVKEYVDNLEVSYQVADVFIVPLFAGSGIRLKILDALNHGLPTVSTTAGYAGLELEEKRDIYVADNPSSFAGYICDLLGSQKEREILSKNGRKFVASHHSFGLAKSAIGVLISRLENGNN